MTENEIHRKNSRRLDDVKNHTMNLYKDAVNKKQNIEIQQTLFSILILCGYSEEYILKIETKYNPLK